MKPPVLAYERPATLAEAVALLARDDVDARVINGGQSLVPMLNLRLAAADLLVDIARLPELGGIDEADGAVVIGAAVKHNAILTSDLVARRLPLLTEAYGHVAHHSVRNRGTLGGSLCHADPAAEMPMVMTVLDATMIVHGPAGRREIAAADFMRGAFDTALDDGEILTAIRIPIPPEGHGACFDEISQRHGDFALAAVGCLVVQDGGVCTDVRVGYRGLGDTLIRLPQVEAILTGQAPTPELLARMGETARALAEPDADIHADEAYRRDLADTLTRRVVGRALSRCAR